MSANLRPRSERLQRIGRASPLVLWSVLTVGLGWSAGAGWRGLAARSVDEADAQRSALAPAVQFYCPMHPSYHAGQAGDCPLCNMDMLPLAPGALPAVSPVEGHAGVRLTPARRQLIGVRTQRVEARPCTRTLRAPARVEVDQEGLSSISLKTGGWVDELFVRSEGCVVTAGQPLFTLYSPELFEAQRKYIVASALLAQSLAAGGGEQEASKRQQVDATRARLALWDMGDAQVAALEQPGAEPLAITPILARSGGVVLARNVRQGARVEPGEALFELADLARVWVVAEVFQAELPRVAVGAAVTIELDALPGQTLVARVDHVYPTLDERTRTARVRVVLDNPNGVLRPGMYATLSLAIELGTQLVVEAESVLDTGLRQLVFVEPVAGEFEPREVVLGERYDGSALVLAGLEEGERVVTSGTFLIDSESRMQAALSALGSSPAR